MWKILERCDELGGGDSLRYTRLFSFYLIKG